MTPPDSLVVVGYAKVPSASAAHSVHPHVAVVLRVDRRTATVTDVDSTAVTGLVRAWIRELLLGRNLREAPDRILQQIDQSYFGHAAGSIKQAVTDAWRRYHAHVVAPATDH